MRKFLIAKISALKVKKMNSFADTPEEFRLQIVEDPFSRTPSDGGLRTAPFITSCIYNNVNTLFFYIRTNFIRTTRLKLAKK